MGRVGRALEGVLVGMTQRGQGTTLMVWADGAAPPLGTHVVKASPAEVACLESTLKNGRIGGRRTKGRKPKRLMADRGYDSNLIRALLVKRAIEPIMPTRCKNRVATPQDGRALRRDKRRWIIERTKAWLQNFRRLVVRYERSAKRFTALIPLAYELMTLTRVLGWFLAVDGVPS
jgi:transposase